MRTQYGRWIVLAYTHHDKKGNDHYDCQCSCLNQTKRNVLGYKLRNGSSQSCGCRRNELLSKRQTKHGKSRDKEYKAYYLAMSRCTNSKNNKYHIYGGRGIQFKFNSFNEWYAELGDAPSPTHSIDRINPDGHYEKGNVRWATIKEQRNNRRRVYA